MVDHVTAVPSWGTATGVRDLVVRGQRVFVGKVGTAAVEIPRLTELVATRWNATEHGSKGRIDVGTTSVGQAATARDSQQSADLVLEACGGSTHRARRANAAHCADAAHTTRANAARCAYTARHAKRTSATSNRTADRSRTADCYLSAATTRPATPLPSYAASAARGEHGKHNPIGGFHLAAAVQSMCR